MGSVGAAERTRYRASRLLIVAILRKSPIGKRVHVAAVCVLSIALHTSTSQAQPDTAKSVLLLHQAETGGQTRNRFATAFVEGLRSDDSVRIELYEETVDGERFPGPNQAQLLRDYLTKKYAGRTIDVIAAQGIGPLLFARQNRALFGNPPIVTTVAPANQIDRNDNIIGLQGGFGITGTIDLALALRPDSCCVFVVDGTRDNNGEVEDEVRRQWQARGSALSLVYLRDLPLDDLLPRVRAIPDNAVVLFFVRQTMRDRSQDVDQFEALAEVLSASNVPVFTPMEDLLGRGVVGGYIWRLEADARRLADMAKLVASGISPRDIPPGRNTYTTMLDWRQLQRWGIPESRLPAGSVVSFREQTFLDRNRPYVVGALVLIIAQGIMIAALWVQRKHRRESDARSMAILRAAPDLMFLQTKDGVYLDYHAPRRELLLVPPERFIGRNMRDVLPPALYERLAPLFERVWESDQPVIGDYEVDLAGSRQHYECRLVRCGDDRVLSVVRDITERTRTEAALVESEQRYALATGAGRAGVWDWNLETNEMYVDPRLKALLGFENHEIANRLEDWGERVHPEDRSLVMERATNHINGATPAYEVEHRMLHKDGSIRWFVARGSVLREDGRPARLVGTDTDITERKHADEALRHAQSEMERMSRLAAFGQFSASIAHEVSQPLTTIIMNARACMRWLAGDTPNLAEVRATLVDVIDAGKRADDIIRHNRGLFRDHIVAKRRLDLNDLIPEVVSLAGSRLGMHAVNVQMHLADDLPPVLGDRTELCQVVLNLVFNGIDAMQEVDVSSRTLIVSTELAGQTEVQVSVRDAGAGLGGVNVDRLFTTGYTTKPTGTGVGLSICKTIAEAHGGRIWATANDGPGATFSFTLPVAVAVQQV